MNSKKIISSIVLACVIATTAYVPAVSEFTNTTVVSASPYSYSNSSAKFTYVISENSALILSVSPASGVKTITVPGKLNGYKVSIGTNSFSNITNTVETIKIPEEINKIHKSAFANCTRIKTVEIGKGCKCIDSNAFNDCYNLKTVNITAYNKMEICEYAFSNCTSLSNLTIDNKTDLIIRSDAFFRCNSLASLDLPGDHAALYVNKGAFNNSKLLNDNIVIQSEGKSKDAWNQIFSEKTKTDKNCNSLLGRCMSLVIFVNHPNAQMTSNARSNAMDKIKNGYDYLKEEAQKYNKTLDLRYETIDFNAQRYDTIPTSTSNDPESYSRFIAQILKSNNSTCKRYMMSHPNATTLEVLNYYKTQNGYDNVFVTVVYNTKSTDFSMNSHGDIVNLYTKDLNNNDLNKLEVAHETCHAAQAVDYYTSLCKEQYINDYLPDDLMKIVWDTPHIGWATAASLGWTDSIYTDDFKSIYWWPNNK